jgi:hypothetical protein
MNGSSMGDGLVATNVLNKFLFPSAGYKVSIHACLHDAITHKIAVGISPLIKP